MEGKQRYTLSDVYHAAKTERHFNYVFWMHITLDILGAAVMKYAGYSLVVVAVGLVAIISILGFFIVLPTLFEPWSYAIIGHTLWGVLLVFSIYFHYFMAIFTKPGSPGDNLAPSSGITGSPDLESAGDDRQKLCKRCNRTKPQRTHHCSICNTCVLKMDHHCPWISNCVGYRNYRYFVSFLFWVTLATAYVSIISGVLVFRKGSLLFPENGRSAYQIMVNVFFGSTEDNIFRTFYDALTNEDAQKMRRRKKEARLHKAQPPEEGGVGEENEPTEFVEHAGQGKAEAVAQRHLLGSDLPFIPFAELQAVHNDHALQSQNGKGKESNEVSAPAAPTEMPQYVSLQHLSAARQLSEGTDTTATTDAAPAEAAQGDVGNAAGNQLNVANELRRRYHLTTNHSATKGNSHLHAVDNVGSLSVMTSLLCLAPKEMLIFMAFMMAVGVCIGAGMLLSFHIYLIYYNFTTIECFESDYIKRECREAGKRYKHRYDRGLAANFAEVFGDVPWYLALLPSTRPPPVVVYPPEVEYAQECSSHHRNGSGGGGGGSGGNSGSGEGSPSKRPLWEHNYANDVKMGAGDGEKMA